MSDSPHKDLILDTIDRLRKRKARPDLERICHMVLRRYGLGSGETERLVGKLVDDEIVFKVEYKGNVSYRNAAKWRRSRIGGVVMNSSRASENLRSAIEALTGGNNDDNNNNKNGGGESRRGASSGDIQKWLAVNYKEMARINLHVALQREVDASRVGRLADGSYVTRELVAPRKAAPPKEKSADTATGGGGRPKSKVGSRQQQAKNSSNTSSCKRGRPTSKRKKFKKQLGPDFEGETVPTKMGVDKCDFCLQTAENNKIGEQEELLFCNDCHAKAHPSCMQYSDELAKRARRSPWQCFDCKVCNICEDSGDGDSMLFCDACDKGFHMDCHNPPLSEKPTGKWLCGWCIYETREQQNYDDVTMSPASESANELSEQQNTDTGGASCLPTPCDSPVLSDSWGKENELNFNKIKSNMEILLPPSKRMKYSDSHSAAADWSVDDVADFIQSAGFLTEAEAFKEQEIDGKSLLLMKRNDVLTGLAIKLGPALKIYNHVRRLQMEGGS